MPLSRDEILIGNPRVVSVEIADLGPVFIRPLSVRSLGRFLDSRGGMDGIKSMLLLASMSLCGGDGNLFFDEHQLDELGSLTVGALKALSDAIMDVNGLSKGADEEAVKNS